MFRKTIFLTLLALPVAATTPTYGQKPQASPKDEEAKLIAVLKSDAPRKAKADACRELGRVGTREAVAPLAALLCNEELSHMARYGLEPIPDPAVDTALRDTLDKVKGRLLVGVIGSIGVRRDPKAIAALAKRLDDRDPEVVQAAARALGKIGTHDSVAPLEKALGKHGRGQSDCRQRRPVPLCRCPQIAGPAHRGPGDLRATRQGQRAGVCEDRRQACRAVLAAQDPLNGQGSSSSNGQDTTSWPLVFLEVGAIQDKPRTVPPALDHILGLTPREA